MEDEQAINDHPADDSAGTGPCTIEECGCEAFSAAPGGSGTHCIGRNAAGGTCNHLKDEHE